MKKHNIYILTYYIDNTNKKISKVFLNKKDFLYYYLFLLNNKKIRCINTLTSFKNNIDVTCKLNQYLYSNRII